MSKNSKGRSQKRRFHLGKLSQIWVGGVADSQTGPKPPKSPFLTRISPPVFPNLTKTLGWVGGFKDNKTSQEDTSHQEKTS